MNEVSASERKDSKPAAAAKQCYCADAADDARKSVGVLLVAIAAGGGWVEGLEETGLLIGALERCEQ